MKFLETKFEEYIQSSQKENLHPELVPYFTHMSSNLRNHNNLIFYGPSGIGKYTQALQYIKKYSPTDLRFERKINFNLIMEKVSVIIPSYNRFKYLLNTIYRINYN